MRTTLIPANPDSHRPFLREWRQTRKLTQQELGALIGARKGIISRYETGDREPSFDVMSKLCKALQITPGQLFAPPDRPSLDSLVQDQERGALELDKAGRAFARNVGADDEEVGEAFGEARLAVRVGVGDCRDQRRRHAEEQPMIDDGGLNLPL